jgi:enoyl-CoA hydratase/carnithine racemase
MTDSGAGAEARVERAGGVLTLTFTRDAKLNAVSPPMLDALRGAVADLASDAALRVLVISGEGRYFTAGMDVRLSGPALGLAGGPGTPGSEFRRNYRNLHLLFDEIEAIEKPVVLAAQGPCLGVGVELGVSCDFRLASTRATFGLPEVPNLGVLPGSGGISRLTRLVGPHWARWLAMAAQTVDADEALRIGLVHRVIPEADFPAEVAAFAAHLAALPGEAVGLAKLAIDAAADSDRTTARNVDRIANTLLVLSDEHRRSRDGFPGADAKPEQGPGLGAEAGPGRDRSQDPEPAPDAGPAPESKPGPAGGAR